VVFILDNYDSFTYNLVQYFGELGAQVEVRRNDQLTVADVEAMQPERIVISPGPCTPQDAGISIDLIRHFAGKVPILGVCLGHQAIGAAFGGHVVRAPHLMHGKTSAVTHDNKTIFHGLPTPMTATRYHSLIVEEKICRQNSKSAPGLQRKTEPARSWVCATESLPSRECNSIPRAC
jgi:anthranilate synthase/aminodeoxychorismate synthase-like glutamine amidotransferase